MELLLLLLTLGKTIINPSWKGKISISLRMGCQAIFRSFSPHTPSLPIHIRIVVLVFSPILSVACCDGREREREEERKKSKLLLSASSSFSPSSSSSSSFFLLFFLFFSFFFLRYSGTFFLLFRPNTFIIVDL